MIDAIIAGGNVVLGIWPLIAIITGLLIGIVVGAVPGLSPSMGVALLVPFTYGMSPIIALILLIAIYIGASYGGSITAITINTPGTASAVVTAIDGYAKTQEGKAARALGISVVSSAVAGIIGTLILLIFAQPLAAVAVSFHPAEYFALAVFGLATISSLAGANWLKAFIAALLGLLINTVGTDPISGTDRFTFDAPVLADGFLLIPALIGLFALSEVFSRIETHDIQTKQLKNFKQEWPIFKDYWRLKWVTLRSALIGTLIGVFPGAGATIAAFISYDLAKKQSATPELFGKGSPEGIAAAEAANSGSVGGAMVPLLTLGIPGSATTAVLVGAMMIHKLNPGPQLFINSPALMYGLFVAMLLANLLLLVFGLVGSRFWIAVTAIPKPVLFVFICLMAVIGAFSVRNSMFDVVCCLGFGILGWILKRKDYPLPPVVLGMVLGTIAETNFRRAVMMDSYDIFFQRPISAILLLMALLSFVLPLLRQKNLIKL